MSEQIRDIGKRRRGGGFSARELLRDDREWAACWSCRKKHPLRGNNADQDYQDFSFRHPISNGCVVLRFGPEQMRRIILQAEKRKKIRHDSILEFTHNASVLEAFQATDQTLDLTSFNSLASSATAGWSSQAIDNSSNLYLDYMAAVKFASVATAPASDKAFYMYGATSLNTTDLPTTGASSGNIVPSSTTTAAALTFPSVSTLQSLLPLITAVPYPVSTITNQTPLYTVARAFGGLIGLFLWLPMVNFSGMAIAASGNSYKYRGVYNTVA